MADSLVCLLPVSDCPAEARSLLVELLSGDEAMAAVYRRGEGAVYRAVRRWLSEAAAAAAAPAPAAEELTACACHALGNFATNGEKRWYGREITQWGKLSFFLVLMYHIRSNSTQINATSPTITQTNATGVRTTQRIKTSRLFTIRHPGHSHQARASHFLVTTSAVTFSWRGCAV